MRELDVLLTSYLEHHYEASGQVDKEAFHQLLGLSDPEIVGYLLGSELPPDSQLAVIVEHIRSLTHD